MLFHFFQTVYCMAEVWQQVEHGMYKLSPSLYRSAYGEGPTCISNLGTGMQRISQLSLWRKYEDTTQGKCKKMHAQVFRKRFLNLCTSSQKLECTYQLNDILLFSRTLITCIQFLKQFKKVIKGNKGLGTELLGLNAVIYPCNHHINLTTQQTEKSRVQIQRNIKTNVQSVGELQSFSSECLNTSN